MNPPEKPQRSANIFWPLLRTRKRIGWRGFLYRVLEWIDPATRSSPIRRSVQVICLVLFLYAFFYVCWPYSEHFSETTFSNGEYYPVELFLVIDPLAGLSTALASRIVNLATLWWTGAILLVCILVPRAFCGYLCPFGTLIDGFDWLVGRHFKRFHVSAAGSKRGWVHVKYYILVKREVHMGLAKVDTQTCLPYRAQDLEDCDICYVECAQAGYDAIELRWIQIELDPPPPEGMFSDLELEEMSRIKAPLVDPDKCVGCGICEYRCHTKYVVQENKLSKSAIATFAENEHRLLRYPDSPEALPKPNTTSQPVRE